MSSPKIKFTDKVKKFIVSKVADGLTISMIAAKYSDQVPHVKRIYQKSWTDKQFERDMTQALTVVFYRQLDELHRLAGLMTSENWKEDEARLKRQIDALKFDTAKRGLVLLNRHIKYQ